jgi:hypothetical protein
LGQLDEAAAEAGTALDPSHRIANAEGEAPALIQVSDISTYVGQGDKAVAWAVQARQIPGDRIPAWFARRVDSTLVWALVFNGELDGVPELCEQCLAAARTAGDLSEQADLLCLMAVAARKGGHLTAARAWLRGSAELAVYGGYPLRDRHPRVVTCARRPAAAGGGPLSARPSARRPGWPNRRRRCGTASGRWPRPGGR